MITCPVCEQQQAEGAECQVCGRELAGPGLSVAAVAEPVVEPMEGLETTALPDQRELEETGPLPDLEPTLQPSAGAVAGDPMLELEATLAAPVEAPGEVIPDLEPTSAAPSGDARTELPLFPVCRYCRTPAGPGERLCGRCGMRLGGMPATPPAATGEVPRLCSCGTPVTRSICPACGARNQTA